MNDPTTPRRLHAGDPAPNIALLDPSGADIELAAVWRRKRTLVSFLRQFGCVFCRAELARLAKLRARLDTPTTQLAVITMGKHEETRAFCAERAPGVSCYSDPTQGHGYRAFGLQRGNALQLFGPAVWLQTARVTAGVEGIKAGKPVDDVQMMPGMFVIETDGRVRFAHYSKNISDYPSDAAVLAALGATAI
jgi:peroxiredoxin